jgi:hypothetical protein
MTMNMTPGEAATIDVNYTFTGAAGTNASVVNIGTIQDALLDFTIPEGVNGTPGEGSSYNASYEILVNHTSFYANKSYEDSRPVINTSYLTVAINNSYEVLQNHTSFYANKSYEDSRPVINVSYDTITNVSAANSTIWTNLSTKETITNTSTQNATLWNRLKQRANITIYAGSMVPSVVSGAVVVAPNSTGNITFTHVDFINASRANVTIPLVMPSDYDSGTISYQYIWTYSGATVSTTVTMGLEGWCGTDGTLMNVSYGTAVTTSDTAQGPLAIHISPVSSAVTLGGTPAPNNLCFLQLYRNGGSLATSAHVMALRMAYGIS